LREWPPLWVALGLLIAWFFADAWGAFATSIGLTLIAAGAGLMLTAVVTMLRARTTPVPHREADVLVTRGPFRLSRNPIYLGDALILAGASLVWGSLLGLLFVPVFVFIINSRFIFDEEARLAARFGTDFETYREETPRWIGPF